MKDFEVLKTDAHYHTWKPVFNAQAEVQVVYEPLEPKMDLTLVVTDLQIDLLKQKNAYMWALFLKILQNPLGRNCVKDQMSSMNPLAVFKKHHEIQTTSPAQMYVSSAITKDIVKMLLNNYAGTRVEFITNFCEQVRLFNEFAEQDEHMGYITIRGLLATAVNSDKDLSGSFAECQPTGVRAIKVAARKAHMISEASLYDSKSDFAQNGIISRNDLKASQHIQEALEYLNDPELTSTIE